MSEERRVRNRHFVATLSDKEYVKLRIDVAMKGLKLQAWITQAIREKLENIEEETK